MNPEFHHPVLLSSYTSLTVAECNTTSPSACKAFKRQPSSRSDHPECPPAGRHLERWLADDARWRDDRSHVASVVGRLKDLERGRPRYTGLRDGDSPDRRAWRDGAEALSGDIETVGARAGHERRALLAACGMTVEVFASLSGALPLMRATDAALVRLGDWSAQVREILREGGEGLIVTPEDVERAGALIDEGRTLPQTWAAAALSRDDMEGAEGAVETAVNRLEAALVTAACQAFTALGRAVNREMKEGRVHPLDTADYPRLLAALEDLADREGVPEATLDLMADWRDADRCWQEERGRVAWLMAEARRLETERTQAADSGGRFSPLSDSWRRDAEVLVADARALAGRERDTHIRALGDDPATLDALLGANPGWLDALLGAIPGWLEADDAVREETGRDDHLRRLRDAARQVLEQPVSGTVPWNGTEPLVKGDRLVWVDERRHDMIVGDAVRPDASGRVGPMLLRPVGAAGTGHFRHLFERNVAALIRNPSCARVAWPDESLRAREVERQFPAADATFSLPCDGMVVVGDRIRWTLARPGDALRSRLDGDTPQVEAVVEGFSPHAVFGADKLVELKVIRAWGSGSPPAPGERIDQRMSDLFRRGCVREPWEDEDRRADKVAEAEKEARRWGRSRSLST